MRKFKDLQGNVFTLNNCVELWDGVIIGTVVGTGANKIFSIKLELN